MTQQQAPQAPQQPSMITFGTTAPEPQQAQPQPVAPSAPQQFAQPANIAPQTPAQPVFVNNSGDVVENPYQSIIDQQNAQIAALMQQNQALNAQVTQMVQSGAQFNQQAQQVQQTQVGRNWAVQPQPAQEFAPVYAGEGFSSHAPLSLDVDVSLEGLAKEIGKKPDRG